MSRYITVATLLVALFISACRAPSGPDDYASQERLPEPVEPIVDELLEGEERLSLGLFYEGPRSDEVVIDDLNAFFYIYEETFSLSSYDGALIEGLSSDRITLSGGPWWGGGVHWEQARDLTGFKSLRLSLRSSSETFNDLEVGMNNSDSEQVRVKVSDYGFSADGAWHTLNIPLTDLAERGVELSAVLAPLVLIGGQSEGGERLMIDGVYLSTASDVAGE